jgi:hypothetical protein
MKGRWQSAAIMVGLFGACIAIPKSIYDAWQTMVIRPEVEVYSTPEVTLSYDPKSKLLTFSGAMIVLNSGNATEVIDTCYLGLRIRGDPSNVTSFTGTQMTLKDGENVLPASAFPIGQGTSRTLAYEIKTTLTAPLESDQIHRILTGNGDLRELYLKLTGKKKSYQSAPFSFWFGAPADVQVFKEGQDLQLIPVELQ